MPYAGNTPLQSNGWPDFGTHLTPDIARKVQGLGLFPPRMPILPACPVRGGRVLRPHGSDQARHLRATWLNFFV